MGWLGPAPLAEAGSVCHREKGVRAKLARARGCRGWRYLVGTGRKDIVRESC